jgi:hypothetical protein
MKVREIAQIDPDPRFVYLLNFAIDAVTEKLHWRDEYAAWLGWAASWKDGDRSPQSCVDIANKCFANRGDPVRHALGQLAWAAKECCYSTEQSGWLVIRYIADAMIAFGIAFPDKMPRILDGPDIEFTQTRRIANQ